MSVYDYCSNLDNASQGWNVSEVLDLDISECNQLTDTSILNRSCKS